MGVPRGIPLAKKYTLQQARMMIAGKAKSARKKIRRPTRPGIDQVLVAASPTLQDAAMDLAAGHDAEYVGATLTSGFTGFNYQTGNFDPRFAWQHQWWPAIKRTVGWEIVKAVGVKVPGVKTILHWGADTKIGKYPLIKLRRR